jgi:hypothetical protein
MSIGFSTAAQEMTIEKHGKAGIVSTPSTCFSFSAEESGYDPRKDGSVEHFGWGQSMMMVDGIELLPYGVKNDMPQLLRETVYNNPNIPGIMEKKQQLLWGQGAQLYRDKLIDGKPGREWAYDADIQNWLESFDYKNYLLKVIVDNSFMQGAFHEMINAKSGRMGVNRVHSIEHLNPLWTRLGREKDSAKATHAFVSNSHLAFSPVGYELYPLFDPKDPFRKGRSVHYGRQYSFATDFYAIPTICGALEWIRRSTAIPVILKALSKFKANAAYHVTSPQGFWDKKREEIQADCMAKGIDYTESMLDDFERLLFRSIIDTLTGESNAGKIWHTKDFQFADGSTISSVGWKIEPIEQNIKEFVETQIAIANKSDSAVSSAVGLHKALSGVSREGSADSGSEQLYAYLMYKLTGVRIPEMIVTDAINHGIRLNFPEKGLKLGMYHEEAQKQEDTTSKDRINNK